MQRIYRYQLIDHLSPGVISKGQIVSRILICRVLFQLLMTISCSLIPDHNPGDDVEHFDLRLQEPFPCFCLSEHPCSEWMATDCSQSTFDHSHVPVFIWSWLLSPFTKWDAARFLQLATRPSLRDAPIACLEEYIDDCSYIYSEQAHAFFPFFPMILRSTAIIWLRVAPTSFIPPTFECLIVLVGILINMICLLVAILALYSLTLSILPVRLEMESRRNVASAVCLVYGVWNPASIFFATNYSESLFSALTLAGHAVFALEKWWLAIPLWMFASYTRSNGSIHSLWLLSQCLGHFCHFRSSRSRLFSSNRGNRLPSTMVKIVSCLCGSVLVFLPIFYHDREGFTRHCLTDAPIKPSWCSEASLSFSLYRYTQRKHWNVGLFHYYEWKQLPNFLLAAPILGLSTFGVIYWIRNSLLHFGKGKIPKTVHMILFEWPVQALSESVAREVQVVPTFVVPLPKTKPAYMYLVDNERLLGHYAILAALTLVGLLVAHVQISTRMILSSSPAAIWFLTYCHLQEDSPRLRLFVTIYTVFFQVLGLILHVNFLPWT